MKLNRHWAAAGLQGAASLVRLCKKNAGELFRVQTAMVYLKGVEIFRELFLYQIGILVCVMFLVFGIILIQGAVIFFISWEAKIRMAAMVIMGGLDFSVALAFLVYLGSSKRWLRQASKYNECVEELIERDSPFFRNGKK